MLRSNRIASTEALICSFCRKTQDQVAKLISNPHHEDYPQVFICDECVRVCQFILADDKDLGPADYCVDEAFVKVVRRWLAGPPEDPAALAEMRRRADKIFGTATPDAALPEDPGMA